MIEKNQSLTVSLVCKVQGHVSVLYDDNLRLHPSLWIPIVSLHRYRLVKVHSQPIPKRPKGVPLLHLTLPPRLAVADPRAVAGGPVGGGKVLHEIPGQNHTMVLLQWLQLKPFIKLYVFLKDKKASMKSNTFTVF